MLKQRLNFFSPSLLAKFSTTIIPNHFHASKVTSYHPILSLESCSNMKDLHMIHANMITSGLIHDTFAASRLVKFCAISPSGDINYAFSIFTQIAEPDVFTWNIMIKGYAQSNDPWNAIFVYKQMMVQDVQTNEYTFPVLLKACSHLNRSTVGEMVHGHVVKLGFEMVVALRNSLIHMYSSCGLLANAQWVFDESTQRDVVSWNSMVDALVKSKKMDLAQVLFATMPERNVVSWNVMIGGFIRNGSFKEALGLFDEMQAQNVKPNEPTLVKLISACAHLGALDRGRWFHAYIKKNKMALNLVMSTALIDMYAKCGSIGDAEAIFEKIPWRDLVIWNAMINGHAMHGDATRAMALFKQMVERSVMPDAVTFVGVLTACSHGGLVDMGHEYFRIMTQVYHIPPETEHYGCMVNLLGRSGHLSEAEELVKTMPVKDEPSVWGALLYACRIHGNIEMGRRVGRILIEMDPFSCGRYALLCNLFADAGKWDEAARVRKMMRDRGIRKATGSSLIDLHGVSSEFTVGDWSHPDIKRIHNTLSDLTEKLKLEGYIPYEEQAWLEFDD